MLRPVRPSVYLSHTPLAKNVLFRHYDYCRTPVEYPVLEFELTGQRGAVITGSGRNGIGLDNLRRQYP